MIAHCHYNTNTIIIKMNQYVKMSGKKAQSLFYIAKKTKALGHKNRELVSFRLLTENINLFWKDGNFKIQPSASF